MAGPVWDWFRLFAKIWEDDQLTGKFRTSVKQLVDSADEYYAPIAANLPEKHSHRVKRRKVRTGRELRLDAWVDSCNIKDVMLYLGSYVNIIPIKSLEMMGNDFRIRIPNQVGWAILRLYMI